MYTKKKQWQSNVVILWLRIFLEFQLKMFNKEEKFYVKASKCKVLKANIQKSMITTRNILNIYIKKIKNLIQNFTNKKVRNCNCNHM